MENSAGSILDISAVTGTATATATAKILGQNARKTKIHTKSTENTLNARKSPAWMCVLVVVLLHINAGAARSSYALHLITVANRGRWAA